MICRIISYNFVYFTKNKPCQLKKGVALWTAISVNKILQEKGLEKSVATVEKFVYMEIFFGEKFSHFLKKYKQIAEMIHCE